VTLNTQTHPSPRILALAMFLYAISLIKFFLRDPLGADVGPQGPIELALLIMAGFTLLTAFHRRSWKLLVAPSAKAFMAFGALAALSSAFSYYPLLSFVKGLSFLLVCGIAVVAASAFGSANIIKYLYYFILIILLTGLVLKLAGGGPLLAIDDYSGRARFTMFALHPAMLADLCAVTLFSSFLMSKRPPLYCQAFLVAINIAAGSRAGSALLVVVLLSIGLASVRLTSRPSGLLFVGSCVGFLLVLAMLVGIQNQDHQSPEIASIGQSLYGDKLDEDMSTLNGRTDVWDAAAPMISHSILFGYGLGGSRDVLLKNTSWAWEAGDTHNALLDLILGGGLPATLVYLLGWAWAGRRAWRSQGFVRIGALGIYVYIAGFGIFSPNLTNLQGLATFLIITVDAMVCAEFSSSYARSRVAKIAGLGGEPFEDPAGT
jgi:O-antigen ligase